MHTETETRLGLTKSELKVVKTKLLEIVDRHAQRIDAYQEVGNTVAAKILSDEIDLICKMVNKINDEIGE